VGRRSNPSLISESEFPRLVEIVGAERRPYHRWLGMPLEHEYTEISRVPFLDFLFESENPANLMKAIDAAHQFRMRAYSKDMADVCFRIEDEPVKAKALAVLADWDYPLLGGVLFYALEKRESSSLLGVAISILRQQNVFPETLPSLERVMNSSYDSERDYGPTSAVVSAVGNLRSPEAGKLIFSLFQKVVAGDYYSVLE